MNLTSHTTDKNPRAAGDPLVYHSNDYKYISDEEIEKEVELREEKEYGRFEGGYIDYHHQQNNHQHKEIIKTLKALNLKIQPP